MQIIVTEYYFIEFNTNYSFVKNVIVILFIILPIPTHIILFTPTLFSVPLFSHLLHYSSFFPGAFELLFHHQYILIYSFFAFPLFSAHSPPPASLVSSLGSSLYRYCAIFSFILIRILPFFSAPYIYQVFSVRLILRFCLFIYCGKERGMLPFFSPLFIGFFC